MRVLSLVLVLIVGFAAGMTAEGLFPGTYNSVVSSSKNAVKSMQDYADTQRKPH